MGTPLQPPSATVLFHDVCHIIDGVRGRIATCLNAEICLTNWTVGKRIKEDVLYNQRAEYGGRVLKELSAKLTTKYGKGWGYEKLKHCVRSAYLFSETQIGYALRTQLSWTHLRSLMSVRDDLARTFYMEMCRLEHWDTRTLDQKIDSQLYERTAISRKLEELIADELKQVGTDNVILPDMVFRSDYVLDMLGLPEYFSEKDLENAIITQMVDFIRELGNDFTFVDRQHRITVQTLTYNFFSSTTFT